ncbi:terpene cyclase/mutase family protein [Candidatus Sumerlaeota bacterium]|nr:terpene cyclase/mutase family protein [Candidatus Sumerlaeota bacterium]
MSDSPIPANCIDSIRQCANPEGGFLPRRRVIAPRPDATAWGIIALAASSNNEDTLLPHRNQLAAIQSPDGRVAISPENADAFWTTALAILAWHGSPQHSEARSKAVDFVLKTEGIRHLKTADSPLAHDSSLLGWPWIIGTSSWAEPTALCIIALRAAGFGNHDRVLQGIELLINRQISTGGWNYGNTAVYDQTLKPMTNSTGLVLNALAGRVDAAKIESSLNYLKGEIATLRSPQSLGWGILGLGAWGMRPAESADWIAACLKAESRLGGYDVPQFAILALASAAQGGILGFYPGIGTEPS